jgi:hypothetical protein
MCQALQKRDVRELLLADRELISLERAAAYLVGRMRIRTPLGAADFLATALAHRRDLFDNRARLAATKMGLYRDLFPREYEASGSPPFSTQCEHEFYRLVKERLFPLDLEMVEDDPEFFWPFIPVRGTQQHDWINGCCSFEDLQTVFKLVLVLGGQETGRWRDLGLRCAPAPPLEALGWTHFIYSCAVDVTPLRYLPLAFNLVFYKTGNYWLDVPRGASFGYDWSAENVAKLFLARKQAEEINLNVLTLNLWLVEDRAELFRAVDMWNKAAEMEAQDGR